MGGKQNEAHFISLTASGERNSTISHSQQSFLLLSLLEKGPGRSLIIGGVVIRRDPLLNLGEVV